MVTKELAPLGSRCWPIQPVFKKCSAGWKAISDSRIRSCHKTGLKHWEKSTKIVRSRVSDWCVFWRETCKQYVRKPLPDCAEVFQLVSHNFCNLPVVSIEPVEFINGKSTTSSVWQKMYCHEEIIHPSKAMVWNALVHVKVKRFD